jgi:hypothetical protein
VSCLQKPRYRSDGITAALHLGWNSKTGEAQLLEPVVA